MAAAPWGGVKESRIRDHRPGLLYLLDIAIRKMLLRRDSLEIINVVAGQFTVKLPGAQEWQNFPAGSCFQVPAKARFQLKVSVDTAYICRYR